MQRARSAVPEATTRELVAWLVRRRRRFRVVGPSMAPTLTAGDTVLADTRPSAVTTVAVNDVIVLEHPHQPGLHIVKRISELDSLGSVHVLSDNLEVEGSDSRSFGPVELDCIIGRVTARLAR